MKKKSVNWSIPQKAAMRSSIGYQLDSPYNLFSMFMNLRNLKCKTYEDRIITAEPFKKAGDCFKLFGISCPDELMSLE